MMSAGPVRGGAVHPTAVVEAFKAWMADGSADHKRVLANKTGNCEEHWNDMCGDDGSPAPHMSASCYLGWSALEPDRPHNVVHAVNGAMKLLGRERIDALLNEVEAASG
jgi:hypothetical protein